MKIFATLVAVLLLLPDSVLSSSGLQTLQLDRQIATEGFITISWEQSNLSFPVELQLASNSSFNSLIKKIGLNNQHSVHLSGLQDGRYFVRLMQSNSQQLSKVASFDVQHRQLRDALKFFTLGAGLFITLVIMLFFYNSRVQ